MKRFNVQQPVMIMALNTDQSADSEQGIIRQTLINRLGYEPGMKKLLGCYNANCEHSHLVTLPVDESQRDKAVAILRELGFNYKQECIMYLDEYRNASLLFGAEGGEPLKLGKFKTATHDQAKQAEAFTYDLETGRYFVVV